MFLLRLARDFLRNRKGLVAIEFAMVGPVMLAMLLGSVELNNHIVASIRLAQASYSIAQIVSEAPNPPGTVNYMDLQMAHDSAMVAFPQVLANSYAQNKSWGNDISITISNVAMTKVVATCTTSCAYTAYVIWTWGSAPRPCQTNLTPASSDSAAPSATTLPPDAYAPGSLIVVDVVYTYRPTFLSNLFGNSTMSRSTYLQPRNVPPSSHIKYDATVTGDPGATTICPGYSS